MKSNRFILLIVALLAMFVTTGLWAQDLKFDGYINSGLGFVSNDNEDGEPYFKAFGVDSESNGYRFRLNGSYTNEAKNAGAKFRLQGQRTMDLAGYLSIPYLYGWVGFLKNAITLTGGLVDDGTWTSADWWWNDDAGEGLGLLLKLEPVKGLIFGVGAYTISQQSGGSNNILRVAPEPAKGSNGEYSQGSNRLPNFNEITLNPEDVKYTFNIAYTLPDAFRFNAIFRTQNKAGWDASRNVISADKLSYSVNDNYAYGGREESMFLQAEFRLLAVKNLTAVMVGTFDKLQDFDASGNILISETLGYKIDNLNFGLNAVQFLYNRYDTAAEKKIDMDPGLLFNPWISYSIDKIVPRLDFVYFMGGRSKMGYTVDSSGKISGRENQWERRSFVNVASRADKDNDDYSVFSVRPSIKFNLDSKIFLEIGDMINFDSATKVGAYGDTIDPNKSSLFTNVFYVDLKFSF